MLQALRDLADPAEGVYNATALLGDRLLYIQSMLDKYQKLPTRSSTAPMALVAGGADRDEAGQPAAATLTEKFTNMIGKFAAGEEESQAEAADKLANARLQPAEVCCDAVLQCRCSKMLPLLTGAKALSDRWPVVCRMSAPQRSDVMHLLGLHARSRYVQFGCLCLATAEACFYWHFGCRHISDSQSCPALDLPLCYGCLGECHKEHASRAGQQQQQQWQQTQRY